MSISWKPWASLGAPSPADAHDARACGVHHERPCGGGGGAVRAVGVVWAEGFGQALEACTNFYEQ